MQLRSVKLADDPAMPFISQLYETTFPLAERRLWDQFVRLLEDPAMQLALVEDEGQPIGFVIWWKLDAWHYVEHIAVDPALRGRQYGGKVMKHLIEVSARRLALECEQEHDEDSGRRIKFYERLDFSIMPVDYVQPPYRKGEGTVPMILMSIPLVENPEDAKRIAEKIRYTVYERFY